MNSNKTQESLETQVVGVKGMTCENCARRLDKALHGLPGVRLVMVERSAEKATITFDSNQTNVAALREVIRGSGYQVV